MFQALTGPETVSKFQKFCGVEHAPVCGECEAETSDNQADGQYEGAGKYVKHRTKYVRNEKSNIANNNNSINFRQNGQILPPCSGSDDSDSDSSNAGDGNKISAYKIKYKSVYYIFRFASFFGDELFYLTFFPFVAWNFDSVVVRKTCFLWCASMYLGQATKDVLRWPRPRCPPVVRLETDYSQEHSMPSTHAMAGTCIPFGFFIYLTQRYQIPVPLGLSVLCLWCVMVSLSRLYLGVHSVLDVLCGVTYSLLISFLMLPFLDRIDLYFQSEPSAPFVAIIIGLLLCTVMYPNVLENNPAKGDAVQIVAGTVGMVIGGWLNYQYGVAVISDNKPPYVIPAPTLKFIATSILRFIIGLVVLALVRTIVKTISVKCASYAIGLEKPDKKHPSVITAYKFTTYTCLGLAIIWSIPILHCTVGLCRAGYSTEVV